MAGLRPRLQALEVGDGFGGLGRGGEDGAVVVLDELEPVGEVVRMIRPRVLRDAELGAQERGADLGDLS